MAIGKIHDMENDLVIITISIITIIIFNLTINNQFFNIPYCILVKNLDDYQGRIFSSSFVLFFAHPKIFIDTGAICSHNQTAENFFLLQAVET